MQGPAGWAPRCAAPSLLPGSRCASRAAAPPAPAGPAGAVAARRRLRAVKLELADLLVAGNFVEAAKKIKEGSASMELELVCLPTVVGPATVELCASVSGDVLGLGEELPLNGELRALAAAPDCAEAAASAVAAVEAHSEEELSGHFDAGAKLSLQACVMPTLRVKWLFKLARTLKIIDRDFDVWDDDLKLCLAGGELELKTWQVGGGGRC